MAQLRETAVAVLLVLVSVLVAVNHHNTPPTHTNLDLLQALRHVRDNTPKPTGKYIALGYNACVDIILDAGALLEAVGVAAPAEGGVECETVGSKEELGSCFLYFFQAAKAAERAVVNEELYAELSRALRHVPHVALLGGNAALMAQVLVEDFEFKVVLGGQVGPRLKELIPEEMDYIGRKPEMHAIGNEPVLVRNDELHLIMEYGRDTKWSGLPPPERANRFIISSDATNAALATLEPLNQLVVDSEEKLDLLVVTGFNMLDSKSDKFRGERIQDTQRSLDAVPQSTPIHLEMASMGDLGLLKNLAQSLFPCVDSIGLNEQELGTLYEVLGGKFDAEVEHSRLVSTVPDPLTVSRAIAYVLGSVKPLGKDRVLSRVHFHCFGFHMIAETENAKARGFAHPLEGAAAGSIKATERACNRTDLSDADLELHLKEVTLATGEVVKLEPQKPYAQWKQDSLTFTLVPVLACAKPLQTVGLGDSISASALAYQI